MLPSSIPSSTPEASHSRKVNEITMSLCDVQDAECDVRYRWWHGPSPRSLQLHSAHVSQCPVLPHECTALLVVSLEQESSPLRRQFWDLWDASVAMTRGEIIANWGSQPGL